MATITIKDKNNNLVCTLENYSQAKIPTWLKNKLDDLIKNGVVLPLKKGQPGMPAAVPYIKKGETDFLGHAIIDLGILNEQNGLPFNIAIESK